MTLALSRRSFVAGAAALSTLPVAGCATLPAKGSAESATVPVNPLVRQRADAQIFRHEDGFYYMTGSVPEYDRLVLRRAPTIAGLATAEERVLWRHLESGPMSGFIWAPELHRIDGQWIMYFAAGPSGGGEDVFRIRTYAIVCDGDDPMAGNWSVLGKLQTPWDGFNLDSTSFVHRGVRYLCWAEREPGIETNSNLYLAPLATPLTLAARPARLTVPTLDWEIQGFKVAEAPALLVRNGRMFITYSASATDARYCLGLLTADEDADIMNPASWTKSPEPVFRTSRETNVYGPGHNSFTVDEQERDILVYHGRDYERIEGDPLFDPNRHTRVQRIYYRDDGTPDFGIPVGNGPVPDRFSPSDAPGRFMRHEGDRMLVGAGPLPSSQFRALPSPIGGGAIMLAPIDAPTKRVAVQPDGRVLLIAESGSPDAARATAFVRQEERPNRVRFAVAQRPGRFLRHGGGELGVGEGTAAAEWIVH